MEAKEGSLRGSRVILRKILKIEAAVEGRKSRGDCRGRQHGRLAVPGGEYRKKLGIYCVSYARDYRLEVNS